MRFVYGFFMGVLLSVIGAILYLAFAGGDYLLQLSPRYHGMASEITALKEAKEQRDQLAARLDTLAGSFEQLTRRFSELQETVREPRHGSTPPAETPPPEPAHPRARAEPPPPAATPGP